MVIKHVLRPATSLDSQEVWRLFSLPSVFERLAMEPLNLSIDDEARYLRMNFTRDYHLFIIESANSRRPMGIAGLHSVSLDSCRTVTVLRPEYWGQGVGSEVRQRVCCYAMKVLGLQRVFSRALACNPGALGVLRKSGAVPISSREVVIRNERHLVLDHVQPSSAGVSLGAVHCACGHVQRPFS